MMDELLKGLARKLALDVDGNDHDAPLYEKFFVDVGLGELLEAGQKAIDYTYYRGHTNFYRTPWEDALKRVRAAVAGAEKGKEG